MELRSDLRIDEAVLREFVRRHGITRLALFGSALRDDFDDDSDVDFLVEFDQGRIPGLFGIAAMERELESTIGRRVDLRTYHDLSRYFRDEVLKDSRVLYAA
ncbi:MAG: nucleotidyltransferase domain-containing protein [Actinomycetota bacterium]|jgi:predicted nucleotidyltransferase|nr:nucleotidyltransferase domain-containing protein [Actinomycetota bacterium]